ncbi:Fic/DOC family protein [Hyphobacterium sp.]|uniref:Fic/DOC family protein n=1 Tax=Hyphobacterium sp. TaxID=2004662 RepID=UPI003BA900EF
MSDPTYCYPPDYSLLRNLQDFRDPAELASFERNAVRIRTNEGVPEGNFSQSHLQAIHRHLFQDVYKWAGEIRTIDMRKGTTVFGRADLIEFDLSNIHERLRGMDYLRGSNRREFAHEAARTLGDVNYVHPFREGNGRTQLQYLKQLGAQADHPLDLRHFEGKSWIEASIKSSREKKPDYGPMERCITAAMDRTREQQWVKAARKSETRDSYRTQDGSEKSRDEGKER